MEFKQKNKNNFWHSPVILGIIFCFLILFIYNIIGLIKKERETAKNKDMVMDRIETLREKKDFYNKEIEELNTEKGVEELARSKYQIARPGEKVVSIVTEGGESNDNLKTDKDHSFWFWLKNMFK